jgi:hypothetical protein
MRILFTREVDGTGGPQKRCEIKNFTEILMNLRIQGIEQLWCRAFTFFCHLLQNTPELFFQSYAGDASLDSQRPRFAVVTCRLGAGVDLTHDGTPVPALNLHTCSGVQAYFKSVDISNAGSVSIQATRPG